MRGNVFDASFRTLILEKHEGIVWIRLNLIRIGNSLNLKLDLLGEGNYENSGSP